jgi:VanZ family protein
MTLTCRSPCCDFINTVPTSSYLRFVPPLALMALIFLLSAQPDLSTGLGSGDLVLRKLAHACVFGALTLLWLRALGPLTPRALLGAVVISLLFAVSDEYHQTFVTGRHGSPVDVGIDALGIGVAVLLARSGRFEWASARP